jgi:hypothetical protein
MTAANCFDTLLLLARPAAGKSEIIDYLKNTPLDQRFQQFHIGRIVEFDDFPMLWTWFEEDTILQQLGAPRLHTDPEGYFLNHNLWDLLIERLCLDYHKWRRDLSADLQPQTAFIEFSRGSEHGGYRRAFDHISPEVASHSAILYVNVPWEESLRKNRLRFNPSRPDSILEHALPDSKLDRLYHDTDWNSLTSESPAYLQIAGCRVPYVIFANDDDVTTRKGAELGDRLHHALDELWRLWQDR